MAKRRRQQDEAWARAKKLCRLSSRHVEMAKKLGLNPQKLPGLRPSPSQRWKLPVAAFIEECFAKRFGKADHGASSQRTAPPAREDDEIVLLDEPAEASHSFEPMEPASRPWPLHDQPMMRRLSLASDLVVFLANLGNDLERHLVAGHLEPVTLNASIQALREAADDLHHGRSPSIAQLQGDPDPSDEVPF